MGQQNIRTPLWLFKYLNKFFFGGKRFQLDMAATEEDTLCSLFIGDIEKSGKLKDRNFCNPPFSMCEKFVDKAISEFCISGAKRETVMALPIGGSQKWFHRLLRTPSASIYYPDCRIWFLNPDGDYPIGKNGNLQGADRDTMIVFIGRARTGSKVNILSVSELQSSYIKKARENRK